VRDRRRGDHLDGFAAEIADAVRQPLPGPEDEM
jgi:hypothetical protein